MYENISRYTNEDIDRILSRELGPKYDIYRQRWADANAGNAPAFPVHIDFELIDKCNQRCTMCPRNTKTHPLINYKLNMGSALGLSDYKRIIDEGSSKALMSVNLGAFAEPLLNNDVFTMVGYARTKGVIDTRLITNGLLLHKHTEEIFDSGLVNLFVSLDAFSEEKYKYIRGSGFKQVKANLISFLEEKRSRKSLLPIVRVSFVDMDANRGEKEDFINFWRDKVDIIDIQIFDNFNIDINGPYDRMRKKKWACRAPWARVAVLSNQGILPCCNFFGKNIPIGDSREGSIEEAWNSEAMKKVRAGILNDSINNCSICQRIFYRGEDGLL